jgi:hypothetical protein
VNPPPIGEALDAAWTVFKKDYAPAVQPVDGR